MEPFKLIKSKTREKIIQLFFSNTEKKYYLRELERLLDIPVGNIRRELLSLEKSGLFKREEAGKLVYYSLDKKSPIFEEFKKIVFKTIGIEATLKRELTKIKGIKEAFIYGSFARGKEEAKSDIDVFIIGLVDEDKLIDEINKLEKKLNREINYTLMTPTEFQKKKKEKNSFLLNVLKNKIIKLI